jgi:ATP-dependent exoDNAse (exonuclease V) beta subunit
VSALPDREARRAIADDLDDTLIVEAAAGTGKTTALVGRILALIVSGKATLARLVAVTFTEKAAGEMKLRLRTEIEKARNERAPGDIAHARLDAALEQLEASHIGTIHGFCAELLRERPVEARVDPLFETLDETAGERVFDDAFERWFQEALNDPPEGVRRVLRRRAVGRDAPGPKDVLRRAGYSLIEQRDFTTSWRREPFDRDAEIDAVVEHLQAIARLAQRAGTEDSWIGKSLRAIRDFVSELAHRENVRGRDHDGLERELRDFASGRQKHWGWKGGPRVLGDGLVRTNVVAQRDEAKARLDAFLDRADADLAACLYRDLQPLVRAYEDQKQRSGTLDFLDLLLQARDLVRDDAAVRSELQSRFTHILVDEFQDTDPLQAEILLLLSSDDPRENDGTRARPAPGKLFIVGDPKQSIYRFRRADVALYEGIKKRLMQRGARLLHLSTSFRSVAAIQQLVNASFATRMVGNEDGSQADYVALEPFRTDIPDHPPVVALPVPRPYSDWGKVTNWSVNESLPDAVGAFVDWLVRKSGWSVLDAAQRPVRIETRHICLLSRRFVNFGNDLTRPYVRALEARGIAHVLVGGRSFHAREEVLALRNVLNAIEWPDDEFSVFATLRGPLFALGDDVLLTFRAKHGPLRPLRKLDESTLDESTRTVADALEILGALHVDRNKRPIADTIGRILEATRAFAGIAIWPSGEQALANLTRVLDQARRFEARGATSFRAFVRHLDEESDRNAAAEAPVVEEGTEGVRIMTVHRAKGLEFPVVILIDPTCPGVQTEPSRFVDAARGLWARPLAGCSPIELQEHRDDVLRHDSEEAIRLTYVAATRARDLLVVPVVGDGAQEGWIDVLNPAVYPEPTHWRNSTRAPNCPTFGDDSVVARPSTVERTGDSSVRPGIVEPQMGTHTVVWWDSSTLDLGREPNAGLRQTRILREDDREGAERGRREHAAWRDRRSKALASGSRASLATSTVSEKKKAIPPFDDLELQLESTDIAKTSTYGGRRFGALVHRVLATIDLAANETAIRAAAKSVAREVGATATEVDAAVSRVGAALKHPVFDRARNAGGEVLRRETDIVLRLDDGTLIEGTLDFAFRDPLDQGTPWTVVEYKTDADPSKNWRDHAGQLSLYVRAVARATGERARGVLLAI